MLSISVVSFYNNFGLICKGSAGTTTRCITNWKLSTTHCQLTPRARTIVNIPLSRKFLYRKKLVRAEHFCQWRYKSSFIHLHIGLLVSESKAKMWYTKLISITWSNLNGFLKIFHCHTLRQICYKIFSLKKSPQPKRVATLPCETQIL